MKSTLHVFAGSFVSREEACRYTEAQWEPEPDESVSDEEYAAWEDRNPTWPLRSDLGVRCLDSGFIETIDGRGRYAYLESYLLDPSDLTLIRHSAGDSNILLLVFSDALGGFDRQLGSTPRMKYCGAFDYRWPEPLLNRPGADSA